MVLGVARTAGELFRARPENKEAGGIPANTISVLFFCRERTQCNWAIGQLTNWSVAQFVVLGATRTIGELCRTINQKLNARGITTTLVTTLLGDH